MGRPIKIRDEDGDAPHLAAQLARFPQLEPGTTRSIYVEGLEEDIRSTLRRRGYTVVEINTLPRDTDEQTKNYLACKAQGVEERTIACTEQGLKAIELQMRAYGMLDRKTWSIKAHAVIEREDVDKLLGWGRSRHTLADNSTVVSAQRKKV